MHPVRRCSWRSRRTAANTAVAAIVATIATHASPLAAAEHYYRDSILARTGPPSRFLIEVPESAAMNGAHFRVTVDGKNRITRVLDSREVDVETVYEYSGDANLPHRLLTSRYGSLTGYEDITRNAAGDATRVDFYSARGLLTGYTTTAYTADHADSARYGGDGKLRSHWTTYFSPDGAVVRLVKYDEGANAYQEATYDPARGIETSIKQFNNDGALQLSTVDTYDSDDNLIRQDLYDANGTWYGAKMYEHNLLTQKSYKFSNGTSMDIDIKYDARRSTRSATQRVDGKLICTFQLEHFANGTIARTVAVGPDASLLAEYPNLSVIEVDQQGHPPHTTDGVIHKKGNWW